MARMSTLSRVLENSLAYRMWQLPFAEQKLAPLFACNDLVHARRVLDVGCGPGTNTKHFGRSDYLGIDLSDSYIQEARRRHGRRFISADVTTYRVSTEERFDLILVNSLLHHLDTPDTRRLLSHLTELLTDDGHIHIFELVLPDRRSVARALARWDRGKYARSLDRWYDLLTEAFEPEVFMPYPLGAFGITFWHMVYFKGLRRR